ncbi:hypothetical protein G6F57_014233 [Rhizopus arrhizus]|uniref:Uncharacterized protein n=1 Tax=Rhizopus oryzae TaxID=64495 RepID=A0A9P6WXG3_RHIOR|nr:hypothetical protein G6F30_012841 [Rhizopus arrhizus]KAG0927924.1 hypothetical protein G6F32_012741 [Rhizopus arrhizus]KAG1001698.1 hypothetical protein G6F27_012632 [Rhizopus arrhizus]KAG1026445.1 hypothetical protein G6F25_012680 [Rhizopus arrhizus]KAG1263755.1 hypothetical protein G6F65_014467 [Rhizopus arrhizus]
MIRSNPFKKAFCEDHINDTIDDDCARMQLLGLCKSLNEAEKSVIRAIVDLIPSIHDCTLNDLSEAHLSASFVHLMMHGLFSTKDPMKIAHCSNLVPDEQSESNVNRPDYKVDVYQAYKYLYTNVYGEIKASKSISSSLLANDFCRIAVFCKDALDQQKLNHTIGFQVTGKFLNKYY